MTLLLVAMLLASEGLSLEGQQWRKAGGTTIGILVTNATSFSDDPLGGGVVCAYDLNGDRKYHRGRIHEGQSCDGFRKAVDRMNEMDSCRLAEICWLLDPCSAEKP